MKVEHVALKDLAKWQAFVDAHPDADPHQHSGWYHILKDCFSVTPYFLRAVDDQGSTLGVLPMYFSKSMLMGKSLSTMSGGALSSDGNVPNMLYEEAFRLRDKLGAKFLLVRGGPSPKRSPTFKVDVVHTMIDVSLTSTEIWPSLNTHTRRGIRKGLKKRLVCELDNSSVDAFYEIYSKRMQELGTPVMGPCLMRAMKHYMPNNFNLFVLRQGNRVVGGKVCIDTSSKRSNLYASTQFDVMRQGGNYSLYWHVIESTCKTENILTYDLGRSTPESGVHLFKKKWRGKDKFVSYGYYFAPGKKAALSIDKVNLRNGGSLRQRIWSHLPSTITNRLGPMIRKQIPFG